jgi:hypothetical protein
MRRPTRANCAPIGGGLAAWIVIALAAYLLLGNGMAGPAFAASKEGQFAVKGVGRITCERFVNEREAKSQAYVLSNGWISGYLSAYNTLADDTLDVAPWQSRELLVLVIENYCRQNPDDAFFRAMEEAIKAMRPSRLRNASERVSAEVDGNTVDLYREIVRRSQQLLLELGYYKGELDGLWGSGTRAAFEAYQAEKGLPVTGLPDQNTLLNLFR